jgi:hypothetical protein
MWMARQEGWVVPAVEVEAKVSLEIALPSPPLSTKSLSFVVKTPA